MVGAKTVTSQLTTILFAWRRPMRANPYHILLPLTDERRSDEAAGLSLDGVARCPTRALRGQRRRRERPAMDHIAPPSLNIVPGASTALDFSRGASERASAA